MSEHLISTRSQQSTCRRCGATLLTAHDQGMPAVVDATPLPDREAEIAALLRNLRTYTHAYRQLIYRSPERIKSGWPAGTIHVSHQCPQQKQQQQFRQQFQEARDYGKAARHHARMRTREDHS